MSESLTYPSQVCSHTHVTGADIPMSRGATYPCHEMDSLIHFFEALFQDFRLAKKLFYITFYSPRIGNKCKEEVNSSKNPKSEIFY